MNDNGRDPNCDCANCARQLAHHLRAFVVRQLTELEGGVLPGLQLPRAEAGHPIRDNARIDLAYVLALMLDQQVETIGGTVLRPTIHAALPWLDGPNVDGFFSYRLAETARLLGGLNALAPEAAAAVESGSAARNLAGRIAAGERVRTNSLVVAARCDYERRSLGFDGVDAGLDLAGRVNALFAAAGWISDDTLRGDQFDIYCPEMYLLAEPFGSAVGPGWSTGLARVLDDLDSLCTPHGAVVWGRSIGVLAEAMTVELAALSAARRLPRNAVWMGRATETLAGFAKWFDRGLVTAHVRRASDAYRGPARRLQLTFDLLGKLLISARWLDAAEHLRAETHPQKLWKDVDRYVRFGYEDAGAWAYRSRALSFVIPVVGGPTAEYAVAPRWPIAFEQPVGGPPAFVPTLLPSVANAASLGERLLPGGGVTSVAHRPGELIVTSTGWADGDRWLPSGGRTVSFAVRGRLLRAEEQLVGPPELTAEVGLALATGRRTGTIGSVVGPGALFTSSVDGIAEWNTPWGSYELVSQYVGSTAQPFVWHIGRGAVVASSDPGHPYNRALYDHLPPSVRVVDASRASGNLDERLRSADVFHMAWPERWAGRDLAEHQRAIRIVRASGARIVWTMHNLVPHRQRDEVGEAIYADWASVADAVIHHSEYGRALATDRYAFQAWTEHSTVRHGHWGDLVAKYRTHTRAEVEADEGWGETRLRVAVLGQPRAEKHLESVIEAARTCNRSDMQFIIRTIPAHAHLATDQVRLEYGHLSPRRYFRRLAAYDALLLPFDPGSMLTSGTVFDCIGAGVAAIGTDWGFLQEMLGDALIRYERSRDGLRKLLISLDMAAIAASADAVRSLQPKFAWPAISATTTELFLRQCGIDTDLLNALGHGQLERAMS